MTNGICEKCHLYKHLTTHHVKDLEGNITGETERVCRPCHDIIEKEYREEGRIRPFKGRNNNKRLTKLPSDFYPEVLPYFSYARNGHSMIVNDSSPTKERMES